jgi:hypothetical protein
LIKLNNLCDSISSFEIESDLESYKFIIDPKKKPKRIWDIIISTLIFYSVIIDPLRITFSELDFLFLIYLDLIVDSFFFMDLILNFFIPFYERGFLIKNYKKIAINYFAKWFFFDLVSSLPFSYLLIFFYDPNEENEFGENGEISRFKNILKISRIYRIIKWTSILRLMKFAKRRATVNTLDPNYKEDEGFYRFFKFLILLALIMHICTCFWIYIGIPSPDNNFTWIYYIGLKDSGPVEVYVASLYFNIVSMFTIGYGDIRPYTMIERLYNCLFLSIALILFSFSITALSAIFSKYSKMQNTLNKKLNYAQDIKTKYLISDDLLRKIRNSIRYNHGKVIVEKFDVIESLPDTVRKELFKSMYNKGVKTFKFFEDQEREFIFFVLPLFGSNLFNKNEVVISYGDFVEEMYIVSYGKLSVSLEKKYNYIQISQIKKNNHFGDILIYLNENSPYILKCTTNIAELLLISRENFGKIKLSFNKNILVLLKKSCEYFQMLEKSRNVIKRLLESGIDIKEIGKKFKKLSFIVMKQNFDDWFMKDLDHLQAEDFILKHSDDKIIKFLKTNMTQQDLMQIYSGSPSKMFSKEKSGIPEMSLDLNDITLEKKEMEIYNENFIDKEEFLFNDIYEKEKENYGRLLYDALNCQDPYSFQYNNNFNYKKSKNLRINIPTEANNREVRGSIFGKISRPIDESKIFFQKFYNESDIGNKFSKNVLVDKDFKDCNEEIMGNNFVSLPFSNDGKFENKINKSSYYQDLSNNNSLRKNKNDNIDNNDYDKDIDYKNSLNKNKKINSKEIEEINRMKNNNKNEISNSLILNSEIPDTNLHNKFNESPIDLRKLDEIYNQSENENYLKKEKKIKLDKNDFNNFRKNNNIDEFINYNKNENENEIDNNNNNNKIKKDNEINKIRKNTSFKKKIFIKKDIKKTFDLNDLFIIKNYSIRYQNKQLTLEYSEENYNNNNKYSNSKSKPKNENEYEYECECEYENENQNQNNNQNASFDLYSLNNSIDIYKNDIDLLINKEKNENSLIKLSENLIKLNKDFKINHGKNKENFTLISNKIIKNSSLKSQKSILDKKQNDHLQLLKKNTIKEKEFKESILNELKNVEKLSLSSLLNNKTTNENKIFYRKSSIIESERLEEFVKKNLKKKEIKHTKTKMSNKNNNNTFKQQIKNYKDNDNITFNVNENNKEGNLKEEFDEYLSSETEVISLSKNITSKRSFADEIFNSIYNINNTNKDLKCTYISDLSSNKIVKEKKEMENIIFKLNNIYSKLKVKEKNEEK